MNKTSWPFPSPGVRSLRALPWALPAAWRHGHGTATAQPDASPASWARVYLSKGLCEVPVSHTGVLSKRKVRGRKGNGRETKVSLRDTDASFAVLGDANTLLMVSAGLGTRCVRARACVLARLWPAV